MGLSADRDGVSLVKVLICCLLGKGSLGFSSWGSGSGGCGGDTSTRGMKTGSGGGVALTGVSGGDGVGVGSLGGSMTGRTIGGGLGDGGRTGGVGISSQSLSSSLSNVL